MSSCWDCCCTFSFDLIPQKCGYCWCPCFRPSKISVEDWSDSVTIDERGKLLSDSTPQDESIGNSKTRDFTFLCFNTQQLLHLQDDGVAKKIAKDLLKCSFDIVCLTEMFDEGSRHILRDVLQAEGLYVSAVTRAGTEKFCGLGEDSGLFIVSKFPIHSARFRVFRGVAALSDVFANKGILIVVLDIGDIKVVVANTHLQAHKGGAKVREMQVLEVLHEVHVTERKLKREGFTDFVSMTCGDFNITDVSGAEDAGYKGKQNPFGDTHEAEKFFHIMKRGYPESVDCYRLHHPDKVKEPGYTYDAIGNKNKQFNKDREKMIQKKIPPEQERLDYIWLLRPKNGRVSLECTECEVSKRGYRSDHYAIRGVFKLTWDDQGGASQVAGFLSNKI